MPSPTGNPFPPGTPGNPNPPVVAVERKGIYAFAPPSGAHDWWEINDMERMYAVVSIGTSVPHAEEIARYAWSKFEA